MKIINNYLGGAPAAASVDNTWQNALRSHNCNTLLCSDVEIGSVSLVVLQVVVVVEVLILVGNHMTAGRVETGFGSVVVRNRNHRCYSGILFPVLVLFLFPVCKLRKCRTNYPLCFLASQLTPLLSDSQGHYASLQLISKTVTTIKQLKPYSGYYLSVQQLNFWLFSNLARTLLVLLAILLSLLYLPQPVVQTPSSSLSS